MTDDKKRKKLAVHEGTGGSHSAAVAVGSEADLNQETTILHNSWTCHKCNGTFSSSEAFWHHSCNQ